MNIDRYEVVIIRRDGQGQIKDDFHATVTRFSDHRSDEDTLLFMSDYRWLLKWKVRRKALDRAFRRYDKHQRKISNVERLNR